MLEVELHGAEDLRAADSNGLSDPYASMSIQTPDGPRQKQKTEVASATLSPVWETNTFRFGLPSDATGLRVVLKDADEVRSTPLTNGGDHSFGSRFRPLRNRPPVFWCHFPESWRQDGENSEKTAKKRAKMGEIWPKKKSAGRRPILDG